MKTIKIQTSQGLIVKIDTNLTDFDGAHQRVEKQVGTLHLLGHQGDFAIFCNRYHEKHFDARLRQKWSPVINARKLQSQAMRKLHNLGKAYNLVSVTGHPVKYLVSRLAEKGVRIPKVMLRLAYSPNDYTAPETAPIIP